MVKITEEQMKRLNEKKARQKELIREMEEAVEAMKELREGIPPDLQQIMFSTSTLARNKRSGKDVTDDPEQASLFDNISGALVSEYLNKIKLEAELEKIEKEIDDLEELMK